MDDKYSHRINKNRDLPRDTWYLDDVYIKINGTQHYVWRAVDRDGDDESQKLQYITG